MKYLIPLLLSLVCTFLAAAQPTSYSAANIHSHNDYDRPEPFTNAYQHRAGSIEADVFLVGNQLLLAHEPNQVRPDKSLESVYLRPLDSLNTLYNGTFSSGPSYHIQLMIDIKSEAVPALRALIQLLEQYPALRQSKNLSIVISGNRPDPETYPDYPYFILFDGLPGQKISPAAELRIAMISDNFKKYSNWSGAGELPRQDRQLLEAATRQAHLRNKKFRLWNAPDTPNAWNTLKTLGVDWINTDRVSAISAEFP